MTETARSGLDSSCEENGYIEYYRGNKKIKPFFDEIHKAIVEEISFQLTNKFNCHLYSLPLAITGKEDPITLVRPDLSVYADIPKITKNVTAVAPELAFEVVTSNINGKETVQKPHLYADIGVKEYWVLDTYNCTIRIYDNLNKGYMSYNICGIARSLVFDDLILNIGKTYQDLVNRSILPYRPKEKQFGLYVDPKNIDFDPWEWLNNDD